MWPPQNHSCEIVPKLHLRHWISQNFWGWVPESYILWGDRLQEVNLADSNNNQIWEVLVIDASAKTAGSPEVELKLVQSNWPRQRGKIHEECDVSFSSVMKRGFPPTCFDTWRSNVHLTRDMALELEQGQSHWRRPVMGEGIRGHKERRKEKGII